MDRMIFVNLPVTDVATARRFYTGLGFEVNEDFSDEQVACVVVSDAIVVMLLEHARFADFITTEIADTRATTAQINALSARSRAECDELVATAVRLGGTAGPVVEDGPMYGTSFRDLDGHHWELIHMPVDAA